MDYSHLSGKRPRKVIACLNLDVRSVIEPVRFYEANSVCVFCNSDDKDALLTVRERVRESVLKELGDIPVSVISVDIYDCYAIMKRLWSVVTPKDDGLSEFFVNLSSGTAEFAVAAMSVCRRIERATAFTVKTSQYSVGPGEVSEMLFREGLSEGYSQKVYDPIKIVMIDMDRGKSDLVACLSIMKDMNMGERNLSFGEIIEKLKDAGAWGYNPNRKRLKTDDAQKERMYFRRNFLNPLLDLGWISEDRLVKNRFSITQEGLIVLDIYYG
jgi:hypothetical protein